MDNLATLFTKIEAGLLEYGSQNLPAKQVKNALDAFKHFEGRTLTDEQVFEMLVFIVFYSGFRAETVNQKRDIIRGHFPSISTVESYTEQDINKILADPAMIKNRGKVKGCVANAEALSSIIEEHGSFKGYLDTFQAERSFENLMLLKEELQGLFSFLGGITVYHFLTDLGMPVLKPDRVIMRMFQRLGLIENSGQLLKSVIIGRKIAEATELPIRYIDIVLVAYGQAESTQFGVDKGICLIKPRCEICRVSSMCDYYNKQGR